MSLDTELTLAQARVVLSRLASEPLLSSPTADDLLGKVREGEWGAVRSLFSRDTVDTIMALPDEERIAVAHHMALLSERIEVTVARSAQSVAILRAAAASLRESRERERADEAEAAISRGEKAVAVASDVVDQLARTAVEVQEPMVQAAPIPAPPVPPAAPPAPSSPTEAPTEPVIGKPISLLEDGFIKAKRFKPDAVSQRRSTFRLWREIVGDKVPSEYKRSDVMGFREGLRGLPNSHGKGTYKHALMVIRDTQNLDVDRISEKTIARHFSMMRQMWKYLGEDEANPRIWADIEHQIEDNERLHWSVPNLDRLLRGRWNPTNRPGNRVTEEDHAWMVAIAGYTGCRVEELARIKSADVLPDEEGIACFRVEEEVLVRPRRRKKVLVEVKTHSSIRKVPIHPKLMEAGILDLARARVAAGEEYLLGHTPSGQVGKRGAEYSRIFSTHKTSLGIGSENVFHSFRHSVETILGSKNVKQQWVDAFLGHKSARPGEHQSVGEKVYLHGVNLDCVTATAFQVDYDPEVEPTLLLQRVRGQIPW